MLRAKRKSGIIALMMAVIMALPFVPVFGGLMTTEVMANPAPIANGFGHGGMFLAPIEPYELPEADRRFVPPKEFIPINNANDLKKIGNPDHADFPLDGYYYMTRDIDLANEGQWTPIGTERAPFMGVFDGRGFVIRNMTITGETNIKNVGLFGTINTATIRNLGMENTNINISYADTGRNSQRAESVGAVVGASAGRGGVILNCYNTGNIAAVSNTSFQGVGGIMGGANQESVIIQNTYNTANISVGNHFARVGGIAGNNNMARNSFNTGNLTVTASVSSSVGGIIGHSTSDPNPSRPSNVIENSFNTGNISISNDFNRLPIGTSSAGYSYAGGIAGNYDGIIRNTLNAGEVNILFKEIEEGNNSLRSTDNATTVLAGIASTGRARNTDRRRNLQVENSVVLSTGITAQASPNLPNNIHVNLIAANNSNDNITRNNNLAISNINGNAADDATHRIAYARMTNQITHEESLGWEHLLDWDFDTVWQVLPGANYHTLRASNFYQGYRNTDFWTFNGGFGADYSHLGLATHLGVDLGHHSRGNADVPAIYPGEVVFAGHQSGNGYIVLIRHILPDGTENGKEFYSFYGHLHDATNSNVSVGQRVQAGDTIGRQGSSDSAALHLHMGVFTASQPMDTNISRILGNRMDLPVTNFRPVWRMGSNETAARRISFTFHGINFVYFCPMEVIATNGAIITER